LEVICESLQLARVYSFPTKSASEQSLEPTAGINLSEVKEEFGTKLGLIGGIDTS
jgi:hypothetical protein